jgi:hypothetical protein
VFSFTGFADITSVQFRLGGFGPQMVDNALQITNISVSRVTTTSELNSLALLAIGLTGLFPAWRRRHRLSPIRDPLRSPIRSLRLLMSLYVTNESHECANHRSMYIIDNVQLRPDHDNSPA